MYQDLWIKGKLVRKGERSCAGRYEAIREHLQKKKKKSLTVLDLGANAGYFSFRLAEDLNATVTMVESNPQILEYHKLNGNRSVGLVHTRASVPYLQRLATKKHFDVILALSVIHHFKDYPDVIDTLFKLGDCLFIEPPAIQEKKRSPSARAHIVGIYEHLLPKAPYILTYTPPRTDKPVTEGVPLRPLFVFDRQ